MVVQAILITVAALGWLVALWLYGHLRRFSNECRQTRVAIAFKGKVRMNYPLVELMLWGRRVKKDGATGQVFYTQKDTSIAILRVTKQQAKQPMVNERVGRWTAKDQTPQENRIPTEN